MPIPVQITQVMTTAGGSVGMLSGWPDPALPIATEPEMAGMGTLTSNGLSVVVAAAELYTLAAVVPE